MHGSNRTSYTHPTHLAARRRQPDRGFTLVELLIVIVILGILATVTVFAVRGVTDKGTENGEAADLRTLRTAVEAYYVDHRANPTEQELVDGGYITELSVMHELTVAGDGTYAIANVRTGDVVGTGAAGASVVPPAAPEPENSTQAMSFSGFDALRYGQGPKTLVVLGNSDPQQQARYEAWVAANPPLPDTQFIFVHDVAIRDTVNVEAALAQSATAWVAQYHDPLGSGHWSSPNGAVVPHWYLAGINAPGSAAARNPGLGNVIKWDDNAPIDGIIALYTANY